MDLICQPWWNLRVFSGLYIPGNVYSRFPSIWVNVAKDLLPSVSHLFNNCKTKIMKRNAFLPLWNKRIVVYQRLYLLCLYRKLKTILIDTLHHYGYLQWICSGIYQTLFQFITLYLHIRYDADFYILTGNVYIENILGEFNYTLSIIDIKS